MKRIALLIVLICLIAGFVTGQTMDLQLAVTTQALTRPMLESLNLSETEIRNILELQEQFRLMKEQNSLEMNVLKAELARMLYKPDADTAEVSRLLEKASKLRLEQEMAQVETYQEIRKEMGEECWSDLMQQVRNRNRNIEQNRNTTRNDTRSGTAETSDHPGGTAGSGGGSSQQQGSSRR